jgi:hypothetical protein
MTALDDSNVVFMDDLKRDGKTIIRVKRGEEHLAWREVMKALIDAGCDVFVRADTLVEPQWRTEKDKAGNTYVVAILYEFTYLRLADLVASEACAFEKYDGRAKNFLPADPPEKLIKTLLERGPKFWDFPSIKGIINTPTMRPDGSLLVDKGYDEATQLYLKSDDDFEIDVPEHPSRDDALAALKLLTDLLSEFPFADGGLGVDSIDMSAALAALMTPVLRGAFDIAPLFFIDKPDFGTGGSYFIDLTSCLSTGRVVPPLDASTDQEKLRNELTAKATEGTPILNLDNLVSDLKSKLLSQMITSGIVDVRPFFSNNKTVQCDCRGMTMYANGNNINIVADLVRRTIKCRIDAKMNRPEARKFKHNPIETVLKNRGKYVSAIFTIVKAYMAKEEKVDDTMILAGLGDWKEKVCHPLMWLGHVDPAMSTEELRALDPERNALEEYVEELNREFGGSLLMPQVQTFSAADVYKAVMCTRTMADGSEAPANPKLRSLFSRDGQVMGVKSIGWVLRKYRDRRTAAGYAIELFRPPQGKRHSEHFYTISYQKPKP